MAVKVGVSLWTTATDQQRFPPREAPAEDFGRKLGLRDNAPGSGEHMDRQSSGQSLSEQRLASSAFSEPDLSLIRRSDAGRVSETMTAGVLELYALGARAGHHLSYSPQSFLAAQAEAVRSSVTAEPTPSVDSSDSRLISSTPSVTGITSTKLVEQSQAQPAGLEVDGQDAVSPPLLSYLTSKWPQRHFQFLPRGKGMELLVRDYHLTSQERNELIGELSRRASSMPERPQQIWLNGQSVWQASSFLNDFQGEPHGR